MAVDKLVDSTQLDADLTTVANAIRTKGGTSASLAFPAGFAAAIAAIPSGGGALNYKTGTFTLASDTTGSKTAGSSTRIAHGLGAVPKVVIIWTEDYDRDNPPAAALIGGYCYLVGLLDMKEYLSSSASGEGAVFSWMYISTTPTVNVNAGTSDSYIPGVAPTSDYIYLYKRSNSQYWRAGVTYKYFVAEAWWT